MTLLLTVRSLINERLSAAAEDIFGAVERIVTEIYEDSKRNIERQRRILDVVLNPEPNQHRADFILLPKIRDVFSEQQVRNPSLVHDVKPEPEEHHQTWSLVVVEEPLPVQEEPETVQEEPQPVHNAPEPVHNAPEPVQKEPEPVHNAPVPVQKEPESVQKAPESVQKEPESVQKEPESVQKEPESVQKAPESVQKEPPEIREEPEKLLQSPEEPAVTSLDSKANGDSLAGQGGQQVLSQIINGQEICTSISGAPTVASPTSTGKLTFAQWIQLTQKSLGVARVGSQQHLTVKIQDQGQTTGQLQLIPQGVTVIPSTGQQLMQAQLPNCQVQRFLFTPVAPTATPTANTVTTAAGQPPSATPTKTPAQPAQQAAAPVQVGATPLATTGTPPSATPQGQLPPQSQPHMPIQSPMPLQVKTQRGRTQLQIQHSPHLISVPGARAPTTGRGEMAPPVRRSIFLSIILGEHTIYKLVLPDGMPESVSELAHHIKTEYRLQGDITLQLMDPKIEERFTDLLLISDVQDRSSIKVLCNSAAPPVRLRMVLSEDCSFRWNLSERPESVSELAEEIKERYGIEGHIRLRIKHHIHNEKEFTNLLSISDVQDLSTIRVIIYGSVAPAQPGGSVAPPHSAPATSASRSSGVTGILSAHVCPYCRPWCNGWPAVFQVPEFSYVARYELNMANAAFKQNRTFLIPSSRLQSEILAELVKKIIQYKVHLVDNEIEDVAKALVSTHPCLKESASATGYGIWETRLKNKLLNYRNKLRQLGCPELKVNAQKRKPDGKKCSPFFGMKKIKAEVSFYPDYRPGETAQTLEKIRVDLLSEVKKRNNEENMMMMMDKTFAHRRQEVVREAPTIDDFQMRWPALFHVRELNAEFKRITTIDLQSKFFSELDAQSWTLANLMTVYGKKGGAQGRMINSIMVPMSKTDSIDVRRECVLKALCAYMKEDPDKLVREYTGVDVESSRTAMADTVCGIFVIRNKGAAKPCNAPVDVGIILDGVGVLNGLGSVPFAVTMLLALLYALNRSYPPELKYTFEALQEVIMELDRGRLSFRVQSLKTLLYTIRHNNTCCAATL